MKTCLLMISLALSFQQLCAQELFIFSEPASNMPAKSISLKVTALYPDSKYNDFFKQRYAPEIMFGISKQLMVHLRSTFSDYYTPNLSWESAKVYAKWRFYSSDDIHRHFRLAAFAEGSISKSPFLYGEINLDGDNDGVQGGLIATQLINKLAVSATGSFIKVFAEGGEHATHSLHPKEALTYTVSAGYLLFPRNYTGYRQTNVNLYMEMIGMRGLKVKSNMIDLAPGIQFIFNSNFKINAGYRFQVAGDMLRVGEKTWLLSVERTFLGALKRKKKA